MDPTSLSMRDWLCVAYADLIDSPDGWVNRAELQAKVDAQLAQPWAELLAEAARDAGKKAAAGRDPRSGTAPRETLDPGPPAPMRPPDAQRPAAWKAREEVPPT